MRRVYCKHSLQHHYENLIRVNGKDMKAFLNSKHKQCIIYKLLSEKWFRSEIYPARDGRWHVEMEGGETLFFLTFDASRFYTRAVDIIK